MEEKMKSTNLKNLTVTLLALSVISSAALAAYDTPWLPDWSSETGYASQFWGLASVEGAEPAQPLSPDIYSDNSYGTATAGWVNDETNGYVAWVETLMGQHPSWVSGVYGGMTNFAAFDIGATIPTGTESGSLLVFVQYDWYAYPGADVSAVIDGATEVTPESYYNYQIGESGSGNPWMRTTQVFELGSNPGAIDLSFSGSGFATGIDSFSITTVVGDASALVPVSMPVPEPATIIMFGLGGMLAGLVKKK
jgi:hypothetical protein